MLNDRDRARLFLEDFDVTVPAYLDKLADLVRQARWAEREACAKIAETTFARDAFHFELGTAIAASIRART